MNIILKKYFSGILLLLTISTSIAQKPLSDGSHKVVNFAVYETEWISHINDTLGETWTSMADYKAGKLYTVDKEGGGKSPVSSYGAYETNSSFGNADCNLRLEKAIGPFLTSKGTHLADTNEVNAPYNEPCYKIFPVVTNNRNIYVKKGAMMKMDYKIQLKVKFTITDVHDEKIAEVVCNAETDFVRFEPGQSAYDEAIYKVRLAKDSIILVILNQFYTDKKFQKILNSVERKKIGELKRLSQPLLTISNLKINASEEYDYSNATVSIERENTIGSGCFISENGYIITCEENLDDNDTVTIVYNETKAKGYLVRKDESTGLCLLKTSIIPNAIMDINSKDPVKKGNTAIIIATVVEQGLYNSISKGIISGETTLNNFKYIKTDAKMSKGSAGGALLNEKGELIGIVSKRVAEGLGLAIPVMYISERLNINFNK
ncbi:MAG: trypsin-like peptidase domain-containing protein [Bacteroidetes bacterium]|nr:trypsin-like peptidase domain-containing protein [Bacteroidota bacterium]